MMRFPALLAVTVCLAACSRSSSDVTSPIHPPPFGISKLVVRPGAVAHPLGGGLLGSVDSVTALNNSDNVVGMRELPGARSRAFRWTGTAGLTFLPVPDELNSEAFGINDAGVIVGDVAPQRPGLSVAAQWSASNTLMEMQRLLRNDSLGPTFQVYCVARSINAASVSAGYCFNQFHATFYVATWDAAGGADDVCALTDCPVSGIANVIDNRGVIAGGPALDFPFLEAFATLGHDTLDTVPPGTAIIDTLAKLTPPGTNFGPDVVFALHGETAVGSAWVNKTPNCSDPVVWTTFFIQPQDIGASFCGQANGIDVNNVVVGTLLTPSGSSAFIWTSSTGTQLLPGLGGTNESSQAIAINDRRHILGTITSSGTKHVVIWTF